jgi:hypothetical protein
VLKIVNAADGSFTEETPEECFANMKSALERMDKTKNPDATLEDTLIFAERAAQLLQGDHLQLKYPHSDEGGGGIG